MGYRCSRHWLSTSDTDHSRLKLLETLDIGSLEEMLINQKKIRSSNVKCFFTSDLSEHMTLGVGNGYAECPIFILP